MTGETVRKKRLAEIAVYEEKYDVLDDAGKFRLAELYYADARFVDALRIFSFLDGAGTDEVLKEKSLLYCGFIRDILDFRDKDTWNP